MSHTGLPGQAIVDYIKEKTGDPDDPSNEKWRDLPIILMQVITSNTYLYTRIVESC